MDRSENFPFRFTDPDHPPRAQPRRRPEDSAPAASPSTAPSPSPPEPSPTGPYTLPPAQASTLLQGLIAAENVGDYGFSKFQWQLGVSSFSTNRGGSYNLGFLPQLPDWFCLWGRDGSPLPVAIYKVRDDAYWVRVDPEPLTRLRAFPPMPGY